MNSTMEKQPLAATFVNPLPDSPVVMLTRVHKKSPDMDPTLPKL